jgi:hypothetical protein
MATQIGERSLARYFHDSKKLFSKHCCLCQKKLPFEVFKVQDISGEQCYSAEVGMIAG